MQEGKLKSIEAGHLVEVGLADEADFPHKGRVDFADPRLNEGFLRRIARELHDEIGQALTAESFDAGSAG